MNRTRAREILAVYRPEASVADDPEMAAALALAEQDAELGQWFAADQASDQQIMAALRDLPVPADLQAMILRNRPAPAGKVIPWRRTFLAAAAALLLTAVLAKYFLPGKFAFPEGNYASVDTFREHMAAFARSRFRLDHKTADFTQAASWLRDRPSPIFNATPAMLAQYQAKGCKVIQWGPHTVSLLCFVNERNELVHLFMADRQTFEDLAAKETPLRRLVLQRELETCGWSDGQRVYLLVTSKPGLRLGDLATKAASA